jgi:hypothetical protein
MNLQADLQEQVLVGLIINQEKKNLQQLKPAI